MPANQTPVNLLGSDDLSRTPFGRILSWAVSYGRYIMIGTEIVVLLAFISRFSLDRKLIDLNEEIAQKKAILEVNLPLEEKIRKLTADVEALKIIIPKSTAADDLLTFIQGIMPTDVYFTSYVVTKNKLTIEAVAGTQQGFSQFLVNMNATKRLKNLEVSQVRRSQLSGTSFQITGDIDLSIPLSIN